MCFCCIKLAHSSHGFLCSKFSHVSDLPCIVPFSSSPIHSFPRIDQVSFQSFLWHPHVLNNSWVEENFVGDPKGLCLEGLAIGGHSLDTCQPIYLWEGCSVSLQAPVGDSPQGRESIIHRRIDGGGWGGRWLSQSRGHWEVGGSPGNRDFLFLALGLGVEYIGLDQDGAESQDFWVLHKLKSEVL